MSASAQACSHCFLYFCTVHVVHGWVQVHEATIAAGAYPSPLNYFNFPKSVCTSVNEVICHGIPDQRPLENGDIVNVDVSAWYKGYHGDLNETYVVGEVDDASKKLIKVTLEVRGKHDCRYCGSSLPPMAVKNLGSPHVVQSSADRCQA